MSNNKGSAEIAVLLIGAGMEVDRLNKLGRSALDEAVLSDNRRVERVLITAGAKTAKKLEETQEEEKERKEAEGKKKQRKELEVKKEEKKKLLDRAKTSLMTEAGKIEKEIIMLDTKFVGLKAELAHYKKEEGKKIQAMTLELNELSQDLDWKLAGRVKAEDVAKCLECPVCLDLCKPPKEVSQESSLSDII